MARPGGRLVTPRVRLASAAAPAAALALTGCGPLPKLPLLHSSAEGVPQVDPGFRNINLSFPAPLGKRTAVGMEPYPALDTEN